LWKTGLVWPPKPACFLSYRRLPGKSQAGASASAAAQQLSSRGNSMAQHGTTLVWSCVLHELRPQRLMAATKGPSSWPDYIGSDGATPEAAALAAPSLAPGGSETGRLDGEWRDRETEGELLLSVPLRRSAGTQNAIGQRCTRDCHQSWSTPPLLAASWHAQQ